MSKSNFSCSVTYLLSFLLTSSTQLIKPNLITSGTISRFQNSDYQILQNFIARLTTIFTFLIRTTNPCDVVLDLMVNHRYLNVGELYDRLVKSDLPGVVDFL